MAKISGCHMTPIEAREERDRITGKLLQLPAPDEEDNQDDTGSRKIEAIAVFPPKAAA